MYNHSICKINVHLYDPLIMLTSKNLPNKIMNVNIVNTVERKIHELFV